MWFFKRKKKPGRTKTPRYVHKSQKWPKLPSISKGRRSLYKTLRAIANASSFYDDQLKQVIEAKEVHTNKDHQKFLIDYIREYRRLLDAAEACLMISLSDAGHVDLTKPLRQHVENVLERYLRSDG